MSRELLFFVTFLLLSACSKTDSPAPGGSDHPYTGKWYINLDDQTIEYKDNTPEFRLTSVFTHDNAPVMTIGGSDYAITFAGDTFTRTHPYVSGYLQYSYVDNSTVPPTDRTVLYITPTLDHDIHFSYDTIPKMIVTDSSDIGFSVTCTYVNSKATYTDIYRFRKY